jgi:hypothetical protein
MRRDTAGAQADDGTVRVPGSTAVASEMEPTYQTLTAGGLPVERSQPPIGELVDKRIDCDGFET